MKLFVWDFHGTLEKGNELAAGEISNKTLEAFGYSQRFTIEDGFKLYGKNWYEYFEYLLPEEPHEKHLELQAASFKCSNASPEIIAKYITPNDHAHDVLEAIKEAGHCQILISNTTPQSIKIFLNAVDMARFFPEGYVFAANGHSRAAGKIKNEILLDFLREKKFEEIIVIGDSKKDINLIDGCVSYLYAHPGRTFRASEADYKIRNLREVLKEL